MQAWRKYRAKQDEGRREAGLEADWRQTGGRMEAGRRQDEGSLKAG
jgi:hypothetical protein